MRIAPAANLIAKWLRGFGFFVIEARAVAPSGPATR